MYANYVATLRAMEELRANYLDKLKAKVENGKPHCCSETRVWQIAHNHHSENKKECDSSRVITYRHSVPTIR